jgi:hypothetical protein
MTDQLVNLTVFIPWIIMAFVLDEKKLTAENLVSLFPGSQIKLATVSILWLYGVDLVGN